MIIPIANIDDTTPLQKENNINQDKFTLLKLTLKAIRSLVKHDLILVTGPQRSGTTITARIIAQETGYKYIDEESFGVHDCKRFELLLKKEHRAVIHCPAMSRWIHIYSDHYVVFVRRRWQEIVESAKRVGWNYAPELAKYQDIMICGCTTKNGLKITEGNLAAVTYLYWDEVQKPSCPYALDIIYDTLRDHPLFITDRDNFDIRQWKK